MILFILFLLVVQSYAACPEGQFYLVDYKESGSCETHISADSCGGINGGNIPYLADAIHYMDDCWISIPGMYPNGGFYGQCMKSHSLTSYYSPGCQIVTYKGTHGNVPVGTFNYGKPGDGFTGSCAATYYMDFNPSGQSGFLPYTNQGGTNCLCAPPGEDDAICVSECPVGTGRRNGDDVTWDPCDAIPGCMNTHANNYNPDANMDDGSCEYCDIDNENGNGHQFFLVKAQTSGMPSCDIGLNKCAKLLNYKDGDDVNSHYTYHYKQQAPKYCSTANPLSPLGGGNSAMTLYNDMSGNSIYSTGMPCGLSSEAIPAVCQCSHVDKSECYDENNPLLCSASAWQARPVIPPYDSICFCMRDGQTELECVSECPEEPLYNIEKVRYSRVNPNGTTWDVCTKETYGCPNPLFEEYDPSHTAHAPYLLTADDNTKYVNPIACHTLTCNRLRTVYDDYCLPEGQC